MTTPLDALEFHHMGLATKDIENTAKGLSSLGYQMGASVHDPQQNVRLTWASHPTMPSVEVVAAATEEGPITRLLREHGEGVYHLGFQVCSIAREVKRLRREGLRVICLSSPKPAVLFGGQLVAFYHIKGFGLVEFVEKRATTE